MCLPCLEFLVTERWELFLLRSLWPANLLLQQIQIKLSVSCGYEKAKPTSYFISTNLCYAILGRWMKYLHVFKFQTPIFFESIIWHGCSYFVIWDKWYFYFYKREKGPSNKILKFQTPFFFNSIIWHGCSYLVIWDKPYFHFVVYLLSW